MSFWRPKTKPGPICPIIERSCLGAGCAFWQRFKGKDPQSEKVSEHWGCAFLWHNTLLTENSQLLNQAIASLQSARNENVKALQELAESLPRRHRRGAN